LLKRLALDNNGKNAFCATSARCANFFGVVQFGAERLTAAKNLGELTEGKRTVWALLYEVHFWEVTSSYLKFDFYHFGEGQRGLGVKAPEPKLCFCL